MTTAFKHVLNCLKPSSARKKRVSLHMLMYLTDIRSTFAKSTKRNVNDVKYVSGRFA